MNTIYEKIKTALQATTKRPFLIAIDGPCGSGKTTVSRYLQDRLPCSVFHMDDFFLQPHQRTAERLSEPGGNVDYERFQTEVLDHIRDASGVVYQIYDCHEGTLTKTVNVPYQDIVLIEGAYSHHPYFKDVYDLRLFLEISEEEQRKRILSRNGEAGWSMFREKWIPMENAYFSAFHIRENCDDSITGPTADGE